LKNENGGKLSALIYEYKNKASMVIAEFVLCVCHCKIERKNSELSTKFRSTSSELLFYLACEMLKTDEPRFGKI
jgi:hypothetical protein